MADKIKVTIIDDSTVVRQIVAQDEASRVVLVMPKEAAKLEAIDFTLPLEQTQAAIFNHGAIHSTGGQ